MKTIKDIEKEYYDFIKENQASDLTKKQLVGYFEGAEIIKLFYRKQWKELLEGLKEEMVEIVLQEAVIKFNSAPQVGEAFDMEKHNHINKMLNEMNTFIYQELNSKIDKLIKDL